MTTSGVLPVIEGKKDFYSNDFELNSWPSVRFSRQNQDNNKLKNSLTALIQIDDVSVKLVSIEVISGKRQLFGFGLDLFFSTPQTPIESVNLDYLSGETKR